MKHPCCGLRNTASPNIPVVASTIPPHSTSSPYPSRDSHPPTHLSLARSFRTSFFSRSFFFFSSSFALFSAASAAAFASASARSAASFAWFHGVLGGHMGSRQGHKRRVRGGAGKSLVSRLQAGKNEHKVGKSSTQTQGRRSTSAWIRTG